MNQAGALDLVGAIATDPDPPFVEAIDGGVDDARPDTIELHPVSTRGVLLQAERHDDEAGANVLVAAHESSS
jgi:hypothetical protein